MPFFPVYWGIRALNPCDDAGLPITWPEGAKKLLVGCTPNSNNVEKSTEVFEYCNMLEISSQYMY